MPEFIGFLGLGDSHRGQESIGPGNGSVAVLKGPIALLISADERRGEGEHEHPKLWYRRMLPRDCGSLHHVVPLRKSALGSITLRSTYYIGLCIEPLGDSQHSTSILGSQSVAIEFSSHLGQIPSPRYIFGLLSRSF